MPNFDKIKVQKQFIRYVSPHPASMKKVFERYTYLYRTVLISFLPRTY